MTKQKTTPKAGLPKRISPELAEVLHMLKALETETVGGAVHQAAR